MIPRDKAGWRDQYDRMLRSRRRLQQPVPSKGDSSVGYDDDVMHFFMDCWHLKDWIAGDKALDEKLRKTIKDEIHAESSLEIAQGLANGWKHLLPKGPDIQKKNVTWEIGSSFVVVDHDFTTDGKSSIRLSDLADQVVSAWEVLLRRHGLIT